MRYHTDKPDFDIPLFGEVHHANHPAFDRCTCFQLGEYGIYLIQQQYDPKTKHTWWGPLDHWIANQIYMSPDFPRYFKEHAKPLKDGMFPVFTVRQIMWGLRMKPLVVEPWETVFNRKDI